MFQKLVFQVQGSDSSALHSVDVLAPSAQTVVLTADDSYRLLFEPEAARYVYVYQQAPTGALSLLYPNEVYSPKQNPMAATCRGLTRSWADRTCSPASAR